MVEESSAYDPRQDFDGVADEVGSRSDAVSAAVRLWLHAHRSVGVQPRSLETSVQHLLTQVLASGPSSRYVALPAGSAEVFARAGVLPITARACRTFTKSAPVARDHVLAFLLLAWELLPLAAAIQQARVPCQGRAAELAREAGLYREAGRADGPITSDLLKDRVVSALTPLALAEYPAEPGLGVDDLRDRILERYVDRVGRLVFEGALASTQQRLPSVPEREVVERFERLWRNNAARLAAQARRLSAVDADDIVAETAERAYRFVVEHPEWSHPEPDAWLSRILNNVFLSTTRRKRRETVLPDDDGACTGSSDDLAGVEVADSLRRAVARAADVLGASEDAEDVTAPVVLRLRFDGRAACPWTDLRSFEVRRELELLAEPLCGSRSAARRVAVTALATLRAGLRGELG